MIEIIEGTKVSQKCDYSFGDQASEIHGIPFGFMKEANLQNIEFQEVLNTVAKSRNYMTLFIDNIRLYKRKIECIYPPDQIRINSLMENSDLLQLCSNFPNMKFIVFTNLEDMPIDEQIKDRIPSNVIKIHAVNAHYNDDVVIPFPYGLQRKFHAGDNRVEIMKYFIQQYDKIPPSKLLTLNHNVDRSVFANNTERVGLSEIFEGQNWSTVINQRLDYPTFLSNIKNHKFMLSPRGNALDCHRHWEILYLRRVPIMKKNEYLEKLFKDYPVLFVNDFTEITEQLLIDNDDLFHQAISMDLMKIDLNFRFDKLINEINI